MILYVAGPMTGIADKNIPAFDVAERRLTARGYTVLSPARHESAEVTHWRDYMRLGIKDVCECEGIALLPGWEHSAGARLESTVGEMIGAEVKPITYWLNRGPS